MLKRYSPLIVIKLRPNLLREQASSLGSPRIGERIPETNLIQLLAEKMGQAQRNLRTFRSA
jgi:hypothetical protein